MAFFLKTPDWFNRLGGEDFLIEELSAVFLLASTLLFALVAWRSKRNVHRIIAWLLAGAFFVMAMKEVSWFQRYLGIEVPEWFGRNQQKELNLHNFATDHIENAYYFAMFVLLALIPFVVDHLPQLSQFEAVQIALVTQSLFVAFGSQLVRLHAATEYKEFFIPLACLFYAVEGLRRTYDRTPRTGSSGDLCHP